MDLIHPEHRDARMRAQLHDREVMHRATGRMLAAILVGVVCVLIVLVARS